MAKLRTAPAENYTFDIAGGKATARFIGGEERLEIRRKFTILNPTTGRFGYDGEGAGKEMFRRWLVGLEGFENVTEVTPEIKDALIEHDPDFFNEFCAKVQDYYSMREDVAEKNSNAGADGTSPQKKSKAKE